MDSEGKTEAVRERYGEVFSTLRRMFIFLKPHGADLVAIFVLVIIVSALPLVPPLVIGMIFDKVILNTTLPAGERASQLLGFIGLILFVETALLYFTYLKDVRSKRMGERLVFEIRGKIFSHLQMLSMSFYDKKQAGSLVSRVMEESKVVEEMFSAGLGALLIAPFTFAGIMCVMVWMNWRMALLSLLPVPFLYVAMLFFIKPMKNLYKDIREKDETLHSFLYEGLSGIRVIKLLSGVGYEEGRFNKMGSEIYDKKAKLADITSRYFPLMGFITSSGILIILTFGGLYSGSEELTGGRLVSFISYLAYLYLPLTAVTYSNHILQRIGLSGKRIFDVLDEKPEVVSGDVELGKDNSVGAIEFREVGFSYGEKRVLSKVSFKVDCGEKVGLIGQTGSGKSTIAKLMVRFYDPESGSIIIGGVDVRCFTLSSLQATVTMVLQDDFLFCDTIRNNLLYGGFQEKEERLIRIISNLFGDVWQERFPRYLDTLIGERGLSISAGERQILCIGRAIIRKPKILILDEATSSLDTETERRVLASVFDILEGSTVVVISHRPTALQNCDRLLEIRDGKVFEAKALLKCEK